MFDPDRQTPKAQEALHKVLPAGDTLMRTRVCPRCDLSTSNELQPTGCPCLEEDIGDCPLRCMP